MHDRQLLTGELAILSAGAVIPALAGMVTGQAVRQILSEQMFRTVFFAVLLVLGVYIVWRALKRLSGRRGGSDQSRPSVTLCRLARRLTFVPIPDPPPRMMEAADAVVDVPLCHVVEGAESGQELADFFWILQVRQIEPLGDHCALHVDVGLGHADRQAKGGTYDLEEGLVGKDAEDGRDIGGLALEIERQPYTFVLGPGIALHRLPDVQIDGLQKAAPGLHLLGRSAADIAVGREIECRGQVPIRLSDNLLT